MNKKILITISIITVVIIVALILIFSNQGNETQSEFQEEITISAQELTAHNSEEDCWIVYEGNVYDFTNTEMHPNMAKTFYSHCGNTNSFEEAAKARHSTSSQERVENYGTYVGKLI